MRVGEMRLLISSEASFADSSERQAVSRQAVSRQAGEHRPLQARVQVEQWMASKMPIMSERRCTAANQIVARHASPEYLDCRKSFANNKLRQNSMMTRIMETVQAS